MVGTATVSRKTFESSVKSKQKKCSTLVQQKFKKPCNGCHKIFVTFAKENSLNFAKIPYLCRNCRKHVHENCACHHCQRDKRLSDNHSFSSLTEKTVQNHLDIANKAILPKRKPLSSIKSLTPVCKVKKISPSTNLETDSLVQNDKLLKKKLNKFKVGRKHAGKFSNPLLQPLKKSLKTTTLMKNTTAFGTTSSKEFLLIPNEMTPPSNKNSVQIRTPSKFQCPFCNKEIYRRKSFSVHLRMHKMFGSFSCTYCPAKFRVKGALGVHLLYIHHECSVCNQLFGSYDDVLFHKFENHAQNWWSVEVLESNSEFNPVKKNLNADYHSLRTRVASKISSTSPNEIIASGLESSCKDQSSNTTFSSCHEENICSTEQDSCNNYKNMSDLCNLKQTEKNENPSEDLFSHNIPSDTNNSLLKDVGIMDDLCSDCTCEGQPYRNDLLLLRKNIGILLSKFCQMDLISTLKPDDKSIDDFVLKLIALSEGKEIDEL